MRADDSRVESRGTHFAVETSLRSEVVGGKLSGAHTAPNGRYAPRVVNRREIIEGAHTPPCRRRGSRGLDADVTRIATVSSERARPRAGGLRGAR